VYFELLIHVVYAFVLLISVAYTFRIVNKFCVYLFINKSCLQILQF